MRSLRDGNVGAVGRCPLLLTVHNHGGMDATRAWDTTDGGRDRPQAGDSVARTRASGSTTDAGPPPAAVGAVAPLGGCLLSRACQNGGARRANCTCAIHVRRANRQPAPWNILHSSSSPLRRDPCIPWNHQRRQGMTRTYRPTPPPACPTGVTSPTTSGASSPPSSPQETPRIRREGKPCPPLRSAIASIVSRFPRATRDRPTFESDVLPSARSPRPFSPHLHIMLRCGQ